MNQKVDEFLSKAKKWQEEMKSLRTIVLGCGLTEEFKWGQPCYTFQDKNIIIISGFKEYCSLNFFKGSLLTDKNHILIKPGENSQASRQIRFINIQRITTIEPILKDYIVEALEIERNSLKVNFKKTSEYKIPEELQHKFNGDPVFKAAFESLTPGRKRGYILHFSAAKQSQTRKSRIDKYIDRIFKGQGLNDCVCGLSKKMPSCDGSHKFIH